MQKYVISDHAREEAARCGISLDILDNILVSPGQIVDTYSGRKAYQSKVKFEDRLFLVRIIVENTDPLTIITVYRTSKIENTGVRTYESNL